MEKNNSLGLIASAILFIGSFTPIFSNSNISNLTYFNNGNGEGIIVVVLSIISALLILTEFYKVLLITSSLILSTLFYTFLKFQLRIEELPNVQIQWGWALLIIGALILIFNATRKNITYFVFAIIISIFLGGSISYYYYSIEEQNKLIKLKKHYLNAFFIELKNISKALSSSKTISNLDERKIQIANIFRNSTLTTNHILYKMYPEKIESLGIRIGFTDIGLSLELPTDQNIDSIVNFANDDPDLDEFYRELKWFNKEFIKENTNYEDLGYYIYNSAN